VAIRRYAWGLSPASVVSGHLRCRIRILTDFREDHAIRASIELKRSPCGYLVGLYPTRRQREEVSHRAVESRSDGWAERLCVIRIPEGAVAQVSTTSTLPVRRS
jgi:hypothetical protein